MDWFKRKKEVLKPIEKKEMPDGLWVKCEKCGEIIYKKELEKKLYVCPKCEFHFRIDADIYISLLFDDKTFQEFNGNIKSVDPLNFKDFKKYSSKYKATVEKTGINEAVITGRGEINSHKVVMALMEFRFLGGSMGSVVGEKISRAIDLALEENCPMLILSSSGGARMHEGILSLMQMAKTSAKLARLANKGLPYISILTNPTTGGTTASYAMLGDIHIAEPGALIGFAGPRVIKQTIGQDLPPGFQRSEFVQSHGFIDMIVHRHELKRRIAGVLDFFAHENKN
ncbi:MAG: acetyl-CoA carboxylase, carboxyltransferase subunit beta [Calditrichaceae bacterium]